MSWGTSRATRVERGQVISPLGKVLFSFWVFAWVGLAGLVAYDLAMGWL